MMAIFRKGAACAALLCAAGGSLMVYAQTGTGKPTATVRPLSWAEVAPIADRLGAELPPALRDAPASERAARWDSWVHSHRAEVGRRVSLGDVDSVVNLLLFGTSFTKQPRITVSLLAELDRQWRGGNATGRDTLLRAYRARADDLVAAAARPNASPRMRDVRAILGRQGHDLATAAGRRTATDYLLDNIVRVRQEAAALAGQLETLRTATDATAAFAERSRVFRDRGLSADSSVLTQFAVDRALLALVERKVMSPGSAIRVAIIGPGLDFVDKQEGFDFYQPQSLQPFTALDSLMRCGLASPVAMVTTIDVSERVNRHLDGAVERARRDRAAYRLVLPRDTGAGWLDEAVAYWKRAGDRIGTPVEIAAPPLPGVQARALSVRPEIVTRFRSVAASVVSDRIVPAEGARFDLVIATNVLVYYDTFEQTLALSSIAAMLRPGGVLLTNDAVLEIQEVPLRSQGTIAVPFSAREGDGERMIWYVRE